MNKLYYAIIQCGDFQEYAVTIETGEDEYVSGVTKTRYFDTEKTAMAFFQKVLHLKEAPPLEALETFNVFGLDRKDLKVPLSNVLRQNQRIRHCIQLPEGPSVWIGRFKDQGIHRTDQTGDVCYYTLASFTSAHYKEVLPHKKTKNSWTECEAKVNGNWINMKVVRAFNF
jgi:hypothetical protein